MRGKKNGKERIAFTTTKVIYGIWASCYPVLCWLLYGSNMLNKGISESRLVNVSRTKCKDVWKCSKHIRANIWYWMKLKPHILKITNAAYLKSDDISQDSLISKSGKIFSIYLLRAYSETSHWSFTSKTEFY